ncbi:c-type cytochrome [Hydrogenimonas cancrithermarum]|uniref:Cytochrome c domain-containing protein n=1 Tax=Hydrogenimonas cancrithermarum TaxID=2993563 RepID=A0ABM8FPQ5_9BACT|nr:c-type cytochrome [Hydrogenimonas cancrithermarum]BDY13819.1 hypothetical protein HCR_21310 [Hydrogenimonas cancrithermarum]
MVRYMFFLALFAISISASSEGERLYMSKGCYGCHGTYGEGIGDYPKLAGREIDELADRLHALQRGIGHTSKRDMMIPFAKSLHESEIEAIAKYLSFQQPDISEDESLETPEEILGGSDM